MKVNATSDMFLNLNPLLKRKTLSGTNILQSVKFSTFIIINESTKIIQSELLNDQILSQ